MRHKVDHVNQTRSRGSEEVLETLHTVIHLLRTRLHQQMREHDPQLTPLEARVLGFFARSPGATQRDLAEHSGRDKGQVARLVNGLRERGWLEAEADPEDRRVTRLRLSAAARRQHETVVARRRQLAAGALANFDAAELARLNELLQKLRTNLE